MTADRARRVALVTGASSGIGRSLARVLALEEGYAVGLVARRVDRLDAAADDIRSAGGLACVAAADVGDRDALNAACDVVAETLGPVDLLVANAGMGLSTDALAPDSLALEREFDVNVHGVFRAIEAVVPSMVERASGHVVVVSSLAAYRGLAGASGYCATKAALVTLVEGLRLEWRPAGIHATTVLPGFVKSEITDRNTHPMPFLMETDRAARKIARAIRRRRTTYAFPWPMVWLAKLGSWLPDAVVRRIDSRGDGG